MTPGLRFCAKQNGESPKNFPTLRMLGSAMLYLNMPTKRCNPVNVKTK